MRRPFLPARCLAIACLLAATTACAEPEATGSVATANGATADAATAANPSAPPVVPPPMAVEPPPQRMPGSGGIERCDAEAAREVVGREATADLVEEARSAAGADRVRTIKPGQMVTPAA